MGKRIAYRPEIDGLRAIAVIPVILFHSGIAPISGGFVGVDVFFVISGYLITTIILSELKKGTFSLVRFYERRARRILPALFLVMLVSLPFAWLWLIPIDMKDFSQSLVAVAFFSSNVLFWRESGYWDAASEMKPLLHTWSLAVEEQYYVIFPLFLILMWRYCRRWIPGAFILVAGISLAAAQLGAYHWPEATYYLLPTRGWELAIGAGIALYLLRRKKATRDLSSRKLGDEALGGLGFLLIGYAVFGFDEEVPFPSFYTLVPTIGAGLIILYSSPQTIVGRFLGARMLVGIGLISYSAYLWHQPLLAFSRHRSLTEPKQSALLIIVLLSFLLAYLSWKFVEKPFRDKEKFSSKAVFSFAVTGSLVFVAIGVSGNMMEGFTARAQIPSTVLQSIRRNEAQCFDANYAHQVDSWLCDLNDNKMDENKSPLPDFIVIGDSHMYSFLPALQLVAERNGFSGAYVGFAGCPPLLGVYSLRGGQDRKNCYDLNQRVFTYIKENKIKNILLIARWAYYTDGDYLGEGINYLGFTPTDERSKERSREVFSDAFWETLRSYGEIGVNVHILAQVPMQRYKPFKVYCKSYLGNRFNGFLLEEAAVTLAEHQKINSFAVNVINDAVFSFPNNDINLYDPADILCYNNKCTIGTADISYYYDDDHLSIEGARYVGKFLDLNKHDELAKNERNN